MIEKKDWEKVLKINEEELAKVVDQNEKAEKVAIPQFEAVILLAKHKLSEFPEDPAPKEIKEITKEIKK